MRRQPPVSCAGRRVALAAAFALAGTAGCHAMFSFEETDSGLEADASDGEGGGDGDAGDDGDRVEEGDGGDDGDIPVTCGDGEPGAGEECDDGNDVPGDGCEPDCTWTCEGASECGDGEVCNGDEACEAHLCVDGTAAPDGTACTLPGGEPGECRGGACAPALCGNAAVDPGEDCDDGNADDTDDCLSTCVAASCGDGHAWAGHEACDDGNGEAGDGCEPDCTWTCEAPADCDDGDSCSGVEECTAHLCVAGAPLPDGSLCTLPAGGDGVCRGEVCASIACGNRLVDPGEDCDDGNTTETDACLNDCTAASCGDGHVWSGVEACDDGNASDNDACLNTCLPARCGDAAVWTGVEQCDDGNADDTDDCLESCRNASCGDAVTWTGHEDCDDGNVANTDECLNTCRAASCGDGYVRTGVEECEGAATRPCTTGCGSSGAEACAACAWSATCTAPAEACDGDDDDCDTVCDNGFACCAGDSGPCSTSCGSTGARICSAGCGWGSCTAPAETCNGLDDDCVSGCDNGFACCAGAVSTCVTSCGSSGSRTCSAACALGACTAPAETCNGADDDCDTSCDNGFGCCAGTSSSCTTACATPGTQPCSGSCAPTGSCCAALETCGNGCDDDCDTVPEDGCTGCAACPGATDISAGGRFTGTLAAGASAQTGTCGGAGAERIFTFTTTGVQDVFLTSHASAFDTALYVRSCTCSGGEVGCSDDADGRTTSVVRLRDLPAGTYNVFLDAKTAGGGGAFQLDAYFSNPGPTGDRCGDPIPLPAAGATGNNCAFEHDYTPGCEFGSSGFGPEVVYYLVVTSAATVTVDTCASQGTCPNPPAPAPTTCVDTTVYIRSVCSSAGTQVVCNDDSCGYNPPGPNGPMQSSVSSALTPGLYYVYMDSYPGANGCGDYVITVTGLP